MSSKEYRPLTIPKIEWNATTFTSEFGELIVEPLDPGFGITFGNLLQRSLYGGIEGSAITSIIIRGINNEFSTLQGVVEDAMQIVLNLKQLIIHNKTGKAGKMQLKKSGPVIVFAKDIETDEHLEILNKDQKIATIAQDGALEIEFFVETGRGYQTARWPLGKGLQEDGRIYLDSFFSPVRRVTFNVEKVRVGRDIDYDKLKLAILTNGAETPDSVLHYAVSLVREQLANFLLVPQITFGTSKDQESLGNIPDQAEHKAAEQETSKNISVDFLLKPIDALEFSVRAHNCLMNAGVKRIIDLVNLTDDEVLKIKNFGHKSYEEVKEGMKSFGLSFGMNIKESSLKK